MKIISFIIFVMIFIISSTTLSQQFTLEWEITTPTYLRYVGDMDGNGICEFIDNNTDDVGIYEYLSPNVKWSVTNQGKIVSWHEPTINSNLLYIDFNNNGVKDIIISKDYEFSIVDPSTQGTIFTYTSATWIQPHIRSIDDYDNDGILEIQIFETNHTVFYSTGINITNINERTKGGINEFNLSQNYPNPFNPSTTIRYSLTSPEKVLINIYDVTGQLVKAIIEEHNQAGEYEVIWNGKNNDGVDVSSGTYFYQLITNDFQNSKKMILLK